MLALLKTIIVNKTAIFVFINPHLACQCHCQRKGRTYSRPNRHWYALQERFRHAQLGRASNAVLQVKLPVSIQTAAEAANYFVVCFVIVIFTDSDD